MSVPGARPRPRSIRPGIQPAEDAEALRHLERAVVGQHHPAAAHPNPLGGRGDRAEQHLRAGAGERRGPVVLGHPVAVVAEPVGELGQVDRVPQRLRSGRALRDGGLVEHAEAQPVHQAGLRSASGSSAGLFQPVSVGFTFAPGRNDLVDPVEDVIGELDLGRAQLALEVLHRARADDRRGDRRVADHEGERHLDQAEAGLLRDGGQGVGGVELALVLRQRHVVALGHHLGPAGVRQLRVLAVAAREPAAAEWAPGDHAHAVAPAGGEHVGLHGPVQQRVGRLLAHEALAAAPLGDPLRLHDRARREGRGADVAHLARLHQVAQGGKGVVDVRVLFGTVDLVEVDPVGAQPAQAVLDLLDDPAARVAELVGIVAHLAVDLGGQDRVVTPAPGEGLAHDLLGLAARVDVGGVDEVDARVEGPVDDVDRLVVVALAPGAEHHRAEAEGADLHAGAAEVSVLHGSRG